MTDEREQGSREIEERPRSPTDTAAAIKGGIIFMPKLKEHKGRDLGQFTNKNIVRQRHNDIVSEKQEAILDKNIYNAENVRSDLIENSKSLSQERTAAIKAEYGSIENYNNAKNTPVIEKNRNELIERKKHLSPERNALIKAEYGSFANYKEAQSVIDSEGRRTAFVDEKKSLLQERKDIISSGNTKKLSRIDNKISKLSEKIKEESTVIKSYSQKSEVQALKANSNRKDFLSEKKKFYSKSDRLDAVDKKYFKLDKDINRVTEKLRTVHEKPEFKALREKSSRQDFIQKKQNLYSNKSESLIFIDERRTQIDGNIFKHSDNIRQYSTRRADILDKQSDSLYFRASSKEHLESSVNSTDKVERRAAKAEFKLNNASKRHLPQHRIIRKSYYFNPETKKIKKKLIIEKELKPLDGRGGIVTKGLKSVGMAGAFKASQNLHGEFSKNENNLQNTGLKAAHSAEKLTVQTVKSTVRNVNKFIHERPYKKASKLQYKSDKANAKLYAKRKGGSTKQMKKHAKQYMNRAKQARKAVGRTEKIGQSVKVIAGVVKKILFNPYVLIILGVVLIFMMLMSMLLSILPAISGSGGSFLGVYLAETDDILEAEEYAETYEETAVQNAIDELTSTMNYDELYVAPYSLNRNPYALISFLSAYSFSESGDEYDNAFTLTDDIKSVIRDFISTYYYLSYSSYNVTRTRTVVDDDGNAVIDEETDEEVEEEYEVAILSITVCKRSADETAELVSNSGSPYSPDMYALYQIFIDTNGYRPDLFPEYIN